MRTTIFSALMVALSVVVAITAFQALQATSPTNPAQVVTTSVTTVVTFVSSTTTLTTGTTVTSEATAASTLITYSPGGVVVIPGFPLESVLAGLFLGLLALGIIRRHKSTVA